MSQDNENAQPAANASPGMPDAMLPRVEAPSISPATPLPSVAPPSIDATDAGSPAIDIARAKAARARAQVAWMSAHKRTAMIAASIIVAVAFGVVVGALASGFHSPSRDDAARQADRTAMQKSIARLTREIATLKAGIEATAKAAQAPKITDRIMPDVTGSIPLPRPAPGAASFASANPPPARLPVVQGWTISEVQGGYVFVEGHGGELFRVERGANLPGLGPVEKVTREDGRWMVVTPRGIIVSMRDRRYFSPY